MRLPRLILQKPKQWWLLGLLSWLSISRAWAQEEPFVFPQMATVTLFKTVGSSKAYRRGSLEIIQQRMQVNGNNYTAFLGKEAKKQSEAYTMPFILRIAGDSLLMPLSIESYTPAPLRAQLLDSLGPKRLENTFFRFSAPVGTQWTCLTSYGSARKWNFITTKLREIRYAADGEPLYVIELSEAIYGISDYEFWHELVISREHGLMQLTGEGMVGGKRVYEPVKKPVKPDKH